MIAPRQGVVLLLRTLVLSCAALLFAGCRCSGSNVVARIVELTGTVERDHGDQQGQWHGAAVGAEFRMGDGVRSGEQSGATLALSGRARLKLGPRSMVRFLPRARPGQTAIDVEVGEAVLETENETLRIDSLVGGVVVEPRSRIRLSKSGKNLRFEVAVGSLHFEDSKLAASPVVAGHGIEVSVGGAVLDRYGVDAAIAPAAASAGTLGRQRGAEGAIRAQVTGSGAAQRTAQGGYLPMPPGESTLTPGTALKIGSETRVLIERGKERASLGQGEFVVGAPGGYLVEAVRGPMRLSSTGQTSIVVPGGVIVAQGSDTSADVEVRPTKDTTVRVHTGTAAMRGGQTEEVAAGQVGTLSADGRVSVDGRGPSIPDLVARAGNSFTVHDPSPPTAVGFDTGGLCPRGAILRLGKQWASGKDRVTIVIPSGTHQYQIHCLGPEGPDQAAAASGKVAVLRDGGTAPVVRTAPSTSIEADGRRYTVLYQSRLPKISVRWSAAPAADHYTLHADSRTLRTAKAEYSFAEGAMAEGTHSLFFEASLDPPRRSPATTVVVSLDRSMPTATIQDPPNGSFTPGGEVRVSGAALPGWKVRVGEQEVVTDNQSRFATKVVVPTGRASLPVVFESPNGVTHYYLRRTSSRR